VSTSGTLDRRHLRRQQTIEEVLDHALAIMAEEGVAGLSLGEIARRMGIRTPSLYVYFPSKSALYDALFARGWQLLLDAMKAYDEAHPLRGEDLAASMLGHGSAFTRWSVDNRAYAQLLFWRPVPGFVPSDEAYRPAVELYELMAARLAGLQQEGWLRADLDVADVQRDWTVLVAGVVSQQLANAPEESFEEGRFTRRLAELSRMFAAHYGTHTSPTPTRGTPRPSPRRRGA
jgi:AcrR family transcriptional regulator